VDTIVPKFIKDFVDKRLTPVKEKDSETSFDLIRASVNLTVASILISFATSLKLPLSTTYVTFMVAMGTSFGDGAWGRESAVYRISGVVSVIGGWFLTAFAAFVAAFTFAYLIHWGGAISITLLILVAVGFIVKTHSIHRKRETDKELDQELDFDQTKELQSSDVVDKSSKTIRRTIENIALLYTEVIEGLSSEDRKGLKKTRKEVEELSKKSKKLKNKIHITINNLREDSIETGHYYVQVLDYLREMVHCLAFITENAYQHIDNNHNGISPAQAEELRGIGNQVHKMLKMEFRIIKEHSFDDIPKVIELQQGILTTIGMLNRTQLKRIKKGDDSTKNSMLYLGVLSETKNLILHAVNLLKAERDFTVDHKVS